MQDKQVSSTTFLGAGQSSRPSANHDEIVVITTTTCHVQSCANYMCYMQAHQCPIIHEACKFHGFGAVFRLSEIPLHTTVLCRESNSNSLVTHVPWLQFQGVSVWYFLTIQYFWTWHIMALAFIPLVIPLIHGIRVHMYPFKLSDALPLSAKLLLASKSCGLARKSPFVQK